MTRRSVLYVAAEVFPHSKTGGLADVAAALPKALARLGCDIRVMSPGYGDACGRFGAGRAAAAVPAAAGFAPATIRAVETAPVVQYLLDAPDAYDRPGNPYQDDGGRDWPDNHRRFALLCQAALALARAGDGNWRPDLIHCNDWHCGLIPALGREGDPATVFTIHNAAFQGLFDPREAPLLGLSPERAAAIALHGRLSMLRAGTRFADRITTVSPQFACEILSPAFGFGLEETIAARSDSIAGILNPVDGDRWNPATDPLIPAAFSADNLGGKSACKRAAQQLAGLPEDPDATLVAIVSRVTTQKMSDVVARAAGDILALDPRLQIALCGEGDPDLEAALARAAAGAGRFAAMLDYNEAAAHLLIAGADILLHPSRFEPCGLSPIYAKRYGTIPVATRVGGHVDSIRDIADADGDGILFEGEEPMHLVGAVRRALAVRADAGQWDALRRRCMRRVPDGDALARAYLDVYSDALATGGVRHTG